MPENPECAIHVDNLNSYNPKQWKLNCIEFLSGRYTRHPEPEGIQILRKNLPLKWLSIKNKGKFIYLQFENNITIGVSLSMTGRFLLKPQKHSHVRFTFENNNFDLLEFYFDDMRNFGRIMIFTTEHELNIKLGTLGIPYITEDPNDRKFGVSEKRFNDQLEKNKDKNICVFLMNQKIFSGIGNYLLSEILFESKIDPFDKIGDIKIEKLKNLLSSIKSVISFSYKKGGCSFKNFTNFFNEKGEFQNHLRVFNQTSDPYGNHVIKKEGPHKRSIHYSIIQQNETSLEPHMKRLKLK